MHWNGSPCLRSSGKEWITKSPWLVKQVKQFSEYPESAAETKEVNPTFRILAPSWAVTLHFPHGFNVGNKNILNCSSEAMSTLCGASLQSVKGNPLTSSTWIEITGARCFSWISLPRMQVTLSSLRFSSSFDAGGMVKRNTITCPEFVPAHNVGEVVVAVNYIIIFMRKFIYSNG